MPSNPFWSSAFAPWLALLAGLAVPLGFAPFGWGWVLVPALALLFAVGASEDGKRALRSAYLFGLGYFGLGVSWVFISVDRYGNGPVVAAIVTTAFVLLLALFPLLCVYLVRKLCPQRGPCAFYLGFPLIWVLLEWVRSWLLTGFPWLSIGYSQTDTWLAGYAPVLGIYGLGLVVALLAGALASVLVAPRSRALAAAAAAAATGVVALALGSVLEGDWTRAAGEPLTVAVLQGNIEQDKKWDPDYKRLTMERYQELNARYWGVDLIVWPEAAVPTWFHSAYEDYIVPLQERGLREGTALVMGVPVYDPQQGGKYNAVIGIDDTIDFYYKRHLVPFGEYVPLRDQIGGLLDILGAPMSDFDAGEEAAPLRVNGAKVGVSVCYEAAFGSEIAEVLPEATLLINVSNDAWFGDSLAPHQHLQMVRMRALETQRPVVRATNTGISAVVGYDGAVLERTPQFVVASFQTQVIPREGATPYVRWRDWPVLGLLAVGLLILLVQRLRRSP